MTVGDNLGCGCLLVLVGFCVFMAACGAIYFMAPDTSNDTDYRDNPESDNVPLITVLALLGCVSVPVFAWLAIRPLD